MSIVQQVIRSNWLQRETIRICRQTINPFLLELQHYRYQSTNPVKYDDETLKQMIKNDKVVIFMKGVPESPRCGFSNAVVQVGYIRSFIFYTIKSFNNLFSKRFYVCMVYHFKRTMYSNQMNYVKR